MITAIVSYGLSTQGEDKAINHEVREINWTVSREVNWTVKFKPDFLTNRLYVDGISEYFHSRFGKEVVWFTTKPGD